jgi:hypothetical protein
MKKICILSIVFLSFWANAQEAEVSEQVFKKRALETTELSLLTSFYTQEGKNASVTGGIGSEQLDDYATDIIISIPIKEDGVLNINGTISAYTSASSSNLNPWNGSGASSGYYEEDYDDDDDDDNDNRTVSGASKTHRGRDDDDYNQGNGNGRNIGTPWDASSGASRKDVWVNLNLDYSHFSEDRNTIYAVNLSVANEYDYRSFGGGAGIVKLFNQKNTELGINANVYLDQWLPEYPTEYKTYIVTNGSLFSGFFQDAEILDQNGNAINKAGSNAWKPLNNTLIQDKGRNTFAVSLSFSQILSKTTQFSVFSDLTYQSGWLANPMQRVYFADKNNFYIGNPASISNYTNPNNKDVFQLADDIERLPHSRIKIPVGVKLNQYINENFVLRSYYRYYTDDWGIRSHTANVEMAIKVGQMFTLYPNYRFYNQSAADYFAPYDQLLSTSRFYTSDYDLSKHVANQFGLGLKYTDIFTSAHFLKFFGIKNLSLDYNYYQRNTGLTAHIVSFGINFLVDK